MFSFLRVWFVLTVAFIVSWLWDGMVICYKLWVVWIRLCGFMCLNCLLFVYCLCLFGVAFLIVDYVGRLFALVLLSCVSWIVFDEGVLIGDCSDLNGWLIVLVSFLFILILLLLNLLIALAVCFLLWWLWLFVNWLWLWLFVCFGCFALELVWCLIWLFSFGLITMLCVVCLLGLVWFTVCVFIGLCLVWFIVSV